MPAHCHNFSFKKKSNGNSIDSNFAPLLARFLTTYQPRKLPFYIGETFFNDFHHHYAIRKRWNERSSENDNVLQTLYFRSKKKTPNSLYFLLHVRRIYYSCHYNQLFYRNHKVRLVKIKPSLVWLFTREYCITRFYGMRFCAFIRGAFFV